jgi:hypothetical protein
MGHFSNRWNALVIVPALAIMLGCQGVSTGKSASQGQGTQTTPPGVLSAAPASISFGNVQTGTTQSQSDTISNTGGTSVTITQAVVTGNGFGSTGLNLPLTLAPGQSATMNIIFAPQATGGASGNVALTNDGSGSPLNIALSGTAVASGSLMESPTSFSFGNVQVGTSQSQNETLTNSGSESLTISQVTVTGAGFSDTGLNLPITLEPSQSATFGVMFAPASVGPGNGSLAITISGSSTPFNLALSGTGVAPATLTATPAGLTFANVQVGQNLVQSESVKNTGGSNATISLAKVTGAGFSISGLSTPTTLTPGQSAAFNVTFAPPSAGNFSGSVAVTSNASNPNLTISLTGSGTAQSQAQLSVSPSTIGVGSVTVGTSGTQTGALNATGASVTVSSVSVGSSEFAVTGLNFPVTIPAGQSVNFTVTFTPQTSGGASSIASFTSNASNSPASATVTGTGVAAPVHTVSLSWIASTSPDIIGYNVYRRTGTTGSYAQINPVLNGSTEYTDTSVADGQTYYYETTAVNSSNEESARSTAAQASIPAP